VWIPVLAAALTFSGAAAAQSSPGKKAPVSLQARTEPWLGDFDGMVERRLVRVLVPYSRTLYFNDKGAQRGLTAGTVRDFEVFLARKYKLRGRPITVVAMPTTRDRLLSGLVEGGGDIAAGNLTITPARDKLVDFSQPLSEQVTEIVVTGPASPRLASLDDLSGREVHVRESSSYYASLRALDRRFRSQGRAPITITFVPEALEDEDLMDMLGAGLLRLIVVDSWKADVWARMVRRIRPRHDLALGAPSSIGWAFRSNSPKLAAVVDEYLRSYATSRATRLEELPDYVKQLGNVTASSDWTRFEKTIALFKKYGRRYRFDYLMLAAQGYQESRLDQSARSAQGAIGIMQVLPGTAEAVGAGDITEVEPNIHAGVRYLRHLYDRELKRPGPDEQNRTLFAFAAYNAGPGRLARLRAEAKRTGLDPNQWFNNVERVAALRVGQETVGYVRNIYKYYVAYKLQLETLEARKAAHRQLRAAKKTL
jgi:membrane-bound lytic murein transglycosylase MltF